MIRESAKPLEAIDSIKIVQVDGLTSGGAGMGSGAGNGGGSGNLAQDAVSAALAYRAQAPVLDGLMKELGLDGSSLAGLAQGAAQAPELASDVETLIENQRRAKPRRNGGEGKPAA